MTTGSRPRIRQLDVLRGVAVVLVLGRHMGARPTSAPMVVQSVLDVWLRVGWTGVDLFFVLSGFLVSGLLFHEYGETGDLRVGRFLVRRGLRIYPAFYAFLVATSIAAGTIATRRFVAEALFVQNYTTGLWDHTWSLAVEEHFYVLLALAVLILVRWVPSRPRVGAAMSTPRDPFRPLIPIFIVAATITLVLRILTARYGKPYFAHHLYPTHLRLDSLLFGVLLAYLSWSGRGSFAARARQHRSLLVLTAVVCLAPAFFLPAINPIMETIGFTSLYVGFGALLIATLYGDGRSDAAPSMLRMWLGAPGRVVGSTLAAIGVYSYSIYLWHLAVKQWAVPYLVRLLGQEPATLAAFIVYLLATIVIGILMGRLIEIPTLALRDRWLPGTYGPPAHRADHLVESGRTARDLATDGARTTSDVSRQSAA